MPRPRRALRGSAESVMRLWVGTQQAFLQLFLTVAALLVCETNATEDGLAHMVLQRKRPIIVLMGDSITRYQYLSLAYFYRHGKWIDPMSDRTLVEEKKFRSWYEFYNYTSEALAPYELCDCFRSETFNPATIFENRYYYSPYHSLVYIQAFGDIPSHGHWQANALPSAGSLSVLKDPKKSLWESRWWDTISYHVSNLYPKPSHLVLNAGHWRNNFDNKTTREKVISALASAGIKSVWKTTTYTSEHRYHAGQIDHAMCSLTDLCFNLSWTANVETSFYWGNVHFKEPIYRRMNEQLLGLIDGSAYPNRKETAISA